MENGMQVFKNEEFGQVRVIDEGGKTLFCGADVAQALGYSNFRDAIRRHCKGVVKRDSLTNGGAQSLSYIPEGDVYRLVTHSKLPSAEKFERWVFDDVLPTIRRTGGYVDNDELFINTYMPTLDGESRAMFKATLSSLRKANEKIEEDKPKVLFAEAVDSSVNSILISDLAKLIKQNGVDIGQNRLYSWMRENGYLIKRRGSDYNSPTQKSMEAGWFEIKERTVTKPDGQIIVTKTPKVTGRGQQYFVNKFLASTK
jgi:anti-repressor protein